MIGFLRLGIVLLVGSTVFYLLLRIYLRSLTKERLEKHWDAISHEARLTAGRREDFIAAGLRRYERSVGRKLLWGVFVLPVAVISVMIYVLNFT